VHLVLLHVQSSRDGGLVACGHLHLGARVMSCVMCRMVTLMVTLYAVRHATWYGV
jgi:hypothetical protein